MNGWTLKDQRFNRVAQKAPAMLCSLYPLTPAISLFINQRRHITHCWMITHHTLSQDERWTFPLLPLSRGQMAGYGSGTEEGCSNSFLQMSVHLINFVSYLAPFDSVGS